MSVAFVLLIILIVSMIMIGENRGVKSFFVLILNFSMFFIILRLAAGGYDPLGVTIAGCAIISSFTLFYINGVNRKTISSLIAVLLVVLVTLLITYKMGTDAKLQGFSNDNPGAAAYMSHYVHINFGRLFICEIIIGLLGAIIDVSISISSSMNEILRNNLLIGKAALFRSGLNIGKDILGTMTNTLLFAYLSGFMSLLVWFRMIKYPISRMLNSKMFGPEIFQMLSSGIGIILIIPATAAIATIIMFFKRNHSL
ncbi:MAG TPA: YibE/F family protein [Ruminiclostridium sp.]|nr:YibE/F family protein [Ruminiclostridium sp.]